MKRSKSYLFFLFLFFFSQTLAGSLYPKPVSLRLEGVDQGNLPFCVSNAFISAYEHAFEARNLPVKLSLPYFHAASALYNIDRSDWKNRKIELSQEDINLINKHGYFIPHTCGRKTFNV